ncbi:MAG: hypothetical protein J0G96_05870 [Flavobacteriia bacterium]|nr:hypothetical protein [Flavobacteriia bacterium]OJX37473.1 MAG: hypothetical protein BGO87_00485 [Flavobacteriia bacterium 40-80]
MKKLVLICSVLAAISFSCQKEVIRPNVVSSSTDTEEQGDHHYLKSPIKKEDKTTSTGSNNGSGITDPNNDPDIARNKSKRN